jgi:pimeloyl-ACP methyl ester carboxylesterase
VTRDWRRSARGWSIPAALLALGDAAAAESRLVPVAPGEALHVVDHGAGVPVVLLPGALGTAFGFRRLQEPLAAAGFRALAVEPLGQGESLRPPAADYSLTAQAERVRALLDQLGLERAVVVGQGLGVSVALRLAARHPERVLAVIAIDGGPAESACSVSLRRALKFAPLVKFFGGQRWLRNNLRERLVESSADPSWVTAEVVDGYLGPAARDFDGTIAMYRRFARAVEPESLRDRLGDVRCPVLLLVGSVPQDAGVQPDETRLMARRLARFAQQVVPGAGHFIAEEAPDAIVSAVVRVAGEVRAEAQVAAAGGTDARAH